MADFVDSNMIDWTRVDELRNEVGNDDFLEVAELFLEEVDEVISRLTDAPAEDLEIISLPNAPAGMEIAKVDVVIRLRRK